MIRHCLCEVASEYCKWDGSETAKKEILSFWITPIDDVEVNERGDLFIILANEDIISVPDKNYVVRTDFGIKVFDEEEFKRITK